MSGKDVMLEMDALCVCVRACTSRNGIVLKKTLETSQSFSTQLLWMEEKLHQLVDGLSHYDIL